MDEKPANQDDLLKVIRLRRVVRSFSERPVEEELLWQVLEMARWAPAASNLRWQRYICLNDRDLIEQVRLVTPGMSGRPTALIVVCVDWGQAGFWAYDKSYRNTYIDIGTAVENMLLAAHALGLGGWPMTSFSVSAVTELLNIPSPLRPEMFVGLGYKAEVQPALRQLSPPKVRLRLEELVEWGPFPPQPRGL
jgi:nitroreductase